MAYFLNIVFVSVMLVLGNPLTRLFPGESQAGIHVESASIASTHSPATTPTQKPAPVLYLPVVNKSKPMPSTPTATLSASSTKTPQKTLVATNTPTNSLAPSVTSTNTSVPPNTPTKTPIPTSTPTKTPVPTSTPTPTPTFQTSEQVFVLPSYSYYIDTRDQLHFVGEVKNEISYHLYRVKVSVNLFDGNGQLLDTESAFVHSRNLPSGNKTCFDVLFPVPPTNWASHSFDAPAFRIDGNPFPNLTVIEHQGSYNSVTNEYNILGQVRNDLSKTVEYITAIGTLYNNSGTVVGCNSSSINSLHLDPGETSAFKITFTGRDYQDVTGYLLQMDSSVK